MMNGTIQGDDDMEKKEQKKEHKQQPTETEKL